MMPAAPSAFCPAASRSKNCSNELEFPRRSFTMRFKVALRVCVALSSLLICPAVRGDEGGEKPRFIDRGEYLEDTTTKLLWQKDGATAGKKNFQQAAEYAKTL